MFKKEWKTVLKNPILVISIIGILLIPLMYGGMFIWAFYDPYGNIEELPIAVVNNDTGSVLNDENIELGNEITTDLKKETDLNIDIVNSETAYEKLKDKEYYLLVEIPEDFSENATKLLDESPESLELIYVPNEGYNFLAGQIGSSVVQDFRISIQEQVTKTYVETMFESIRTMADGYQSAEEAASDLQAGANELNEGTADLDQGIATFSENQHLLSKSTGDLAVGSNELQTGTESLATGLGQLSDAQLQLIDGSAQTESGSRRLQEGILEAREGLLAAKDSLGEVSEGTEQLEAGATSLTSGLNEVKSVTEASAAGAAELAQGITALKEQLAPILSTVPEDSQALLNQTFEALTTGANQIEQGNGELASALGKLSSASSEVTSQLATLKEGQQAIHHGLGELHTGTAALATGAEELIQGNEQLTIGLETFSSKLGEAKVGSDNLLAGTMDLTDGTQKLNDASIALANGSDELKEGSVALLDGTTEIRGGVDTFHEELREAAEESAEFDPSEQTAGTVAGLVQMTKNEINSVPNYGTGFTPYFLSLALFVGALAIMMVYPLRESIGKPTSAFTWFLSKFSVLASVGIFQALIVSIVILFVLNIEVQSIPLFLLFAIITSMSFMALTQFFVTVFDNPGRYIVLILMILQLTTSAGTFPIELIPEALQGFHQFLPMTYSVQGFKEVISTGNFAAMWDNAYILIGYMLGFMTLSYLYFALKRKKDFTEETA